DQAGRALVALAVAVAVAVAAGKAVLAGFRIGQAAVIGRIRHWLRRWRAAGAAGPAAVRQRADRGGNPRARQAHHQPDDREGDEQAEITWQVPGREQLTAVDRGGG